MIEIETKLRVDDLPAVVERLRQTGAQFIGRYMEANHILDSRDGSLRKASCGLRVRAMELLDGEPAPATLTYKGPKEKSAVKRREEIETEISNAAQAVSILIALGFETVLQYRKQRERWILDECRVELDKVPHLGTFVEIEGTHENEIAAVQAKLNLCQLPHEPKSYVRMLLDHCKNTGRSPLAIDFER